MPFDGPGLEYKPDDNSLLGFGSLMPPPEKTPNPIVRLLKYPARLLAIPFKAIAALLRLPARLFGRGSDDD